MLRTTTAQNFTSTKIYDLLIGLGAEKKKAEIAIGEFVELRPKALASSTTETGLDVTLPTDKGDIWRLESIISENKNDTDIKLKDIESKIVETKSNLEKIITENRNDLEKIITKNRNDLEKIITDNRNDLERIITDNKNDTDLKFKDIDLKIERMRTEVEKNKNALLFWGVTAQLTIGGLVVTILQFLQN